VTTKQIRILGIHYGIVKLYPTSKGSSDMIEMEHTYLVPRGRDHLHTEGEEEDTIEGETIEN
jgi:hypothetical protein